MVRPADAMAAFARHGVTFWAGVPDSLLADFCRCVEDNAAPGAHVVAANEGGAVALAAGYHLATGRVGGVYLQNSGLGNTINPLVSLADPAVYGIPLVLVVGWRGEPGRHDEPQHVRQGETTLELLAIIGVPARAMTAEPAAFDGDVEWAVTSARERGGPTALVVPAGLFEPYAGRSTRVDEPGSLRREAALRVIIETLSADVAFVATTGKTSRELSELRESTGESGGDFLTIGSMGHASQIALGLALARPDRRVCILDGDGAALMHLGSFAVVGEHQPANVLHIVLNNQAHESVGGQPTPSRNLDFPKLALAAGYRAAETVDRLDAVGSALRRLADGDGPSLLEIRIEPGSRADLGRPRARPAENRDRFMAWLQE